jgi:hypothetical protein
MVQLALGVAAELEGSVSVEVVDPARSSPGHRYHRQLGEEDGPRRHSRRRHHPLRRRRRDRMQIIENAFDSLDAPVREWARNLPIAGGYMEQYVLPQPRTFAPRIQAVMGRGQEQGTGKGPAPAPARERHGCIHRDTQARNDDDRGHSG